MIARVWTGVTMAGDSKKYAEYLSATGIPELEATPGNTGVFVLRSIEGDRANFVVMSLWDSIESVKGFAGDDVTRARYYPEDESFLLHPPERVTHYQVVHDPYAR